VRTRPLRAAVDDPVSVLDELVAHVRAARKYRSVSPEVIRTIGRLELSRRRNPAEAVKTTKRRLHQIAGAYWPAGMPVDRWLGELCAAEAADLRPTCRSIMVDHASTRERLPFLEEFYRTLMGDIGPIRSVLDIGCGLNPLSLPWMPVAANCTYHACDIYEDLAGMLDLFFKRAEVRGRAGTWNALHPAPVEKVDVALLLKLLPCLEQVAHHASEELLQALPARFLVVSFPLHSLGGRRDKGMRENYEERFLRIAESRSWRVERFVFPTELVFRVGTNP